MPNLIVSFEIFTIHFLREDVLPDLFLGVVNHVCFLDNLTSALLTPWNLLAGLH